MPSYGMLRHVALVKTNVSEERFASLISATRISKLGTMLADNTFLQNIGFYKIHIA
jgi:hypothetical protein